jgi:predicted aconitase
MRKIIQGLSFGSPVRDEPAQTKAGTAGQVLGEAVGFTIPALKVAQAASKAQATTRAGQVGVSYKEHW